MNIGHCISICVHYVIICDTAVSCADHTMYILCKWECLSHKADYLLPVGGAMTMCEYCHVAMFGPEL